MSNYIPRETVVEINNMSGTLCPMFTFCCGLARIVYPYLRDSLQALGQSHGCSRELKIILAYEPTQNQIQIANSSTTSRKDLLHISHIAPIPYPTMHHFVTEMCTCVHISVTYKIVHCETFVRCIVGLMRWLYCLVIWFRFVYFYIIPQLMLCCLFQPSLKVVIILSCFSQSTIFEQFRKGNWRKYN